jgi:hypothetical protein
MVIHPVAARGDRQAAPAMLGERIEHVVEEVDVGVDVDRSAVERETQVDLRLFGGPLDDCATVDQLSVPFFVAPLPLALP